MGGLDGMPVAIEQHCEWITDCISHMRANGIERIEAKPEAKDGWVENVKEAAKLMLAPSGETLLASGRQRCRQATPLQSAHSHNGPYDKCAILLTPQ